VANDLVAYTDGGICGKNPSRYGLSWAVVYLPAGEPDPEPVIISGNVPAESLGMETVENNLAETLAVLKALQSVPDGYRLTEVYTDSENALRRGKFPDKGKFGACPPWVQSEMKEARRKHHPRWYLVGGHPTRAELARGFREKMPGRSGAELPVSKWNELADRHCQQQAAHLRTVIDAAGSVNAETAGDGKPKEPARPLLPEGPTYGVYRRPR
jgi:ribonuclease HI